MSHFAPPPPAASAPEESLLAHEVRAWGGRGWIGVPPTGPRVVLGRLCALPARLWRYRDLLAASLARERRARLQGTALGMLWPFVQPLCLFAIYGLLFGSVLGVRMPVAAEWGVPLDWGYGLWLWSGALVWASFSDCLARGVSCIVDQRGIVRKLAFPCEVLPLEIVLSSLLTLGIGLLAYLGASAMILGLWPTAALAWVPLLVVVQLVWMWGFTLLFAALQVWLRDTQHALGVLLSLALFATPVFWVPSADVLPGLGPWMDIVTANPLHHLLNAWRGVLLPRAPPSCFTTSVAGSLGVLVPWAVATFLAGYAVFAASQDHFADEI